MAASGEGGLEGRRLAGAADGHGGHNGHVGGSC